MTPLQSETREESSDVETTYLLLSLDICSHLIGKAGTHVFQPTHRFVIIAKIGFCQVPVSILQGSKPHKLITLLQTTKPSKSFFALSMCLQPNGTEQQ